MAMGRIALTGGIASGKSAAAQYFMDLGVPVIDTDQIARALTTPGEAAFGSILNHFGPGVLDRNGQLNRHVLREQVFYNDRDKKALEGILHPLIRQEILKLLEERIEAVYAIVVIPLLFEAIGFKEIFHRALVIDADDEQRKQRALQRPGMSEEIFKKICQSQLDRATRNHLADDLINNNMTFTVLSDQVKAFHLYYENVFKSAHLLPHL